MKHLLIIFFTAACTFANAQVGYDSLQTILEHQKQIKFCEDDRFGGTDYDASNAVRAMIRAKLKAIKIKDSYKSSSWDFNIYGKINCKGEVGSLDFRNVNNDAAEIDFILSALKLLGDLTYPKAKVDVNFTYVTVQCNKGVISFS